MKFIPSFTFIIKAGIAMAAFSFLMRVVPLPENVKSLFRG